jgi:pimeloyl-ACP methyl ester carboxylesterase
VTFIEEFNQTSAGNCNIAVGPENGPPLVFFHGVTRRWQCFLPILSAISTRWQVFAMDFPGHGRSLARLEDYRVASYSRIAGEWLQSRFQDPVAIYGHSLGAMVAAEVAGQTRSPVTAAILEDPPFHTMGQRIATKPLLSYFQGLEPFAGKIDPANPDELRRLHDVQITDPLSGNRTRVGDTRPQSAIRFMADCLSHLDPKVLEPIVSESWLQHYSVANVSRRLAIPILLLQADPKLGGMLEQIDLDIVQELGADVTLSSREGVGHQMHWGDPGWVINECTLFLETLPLRKNW